MARSATAVAWLVVMTGFVEGAAGQELLTVGIRLSPRIAIPEWTLTQARNIVSEVYTDAGVAMAWAEPGNTGPDLQVVLILAAELPGPLSKTRDVLAVAIAADTGSGRIAYIDWPAVQEFAQSKRLAAPNVLGRVIAHEVGHLLLGHRAHSDEGIMRAHWNKADFASIGDRVAFTPLQAARLRERIRDELKAIARRDR